MTIAEQWNAVGTNEADLSHLITENIPHISSKDPLVPIKRNLLFNMAWGLVILIGYLLLVLRYPLPILMICVSIITVATLWTCSRTFLLYRSLNRADPNVPLLAEMERHYRGIKKWERLQRHLCLVLFPVCIVGGILFGMSVGSHRPVGELIDERLTIILLLTLLH